MAKKKLEFDFDDFDDMIELAETSPTMRDALENLQIALNQAQMVYELATPYIKPMSEIEKHAKIAAMWGKLIKSKKR